MRGGKNVSINILDDVKLSSQELIKYAFDLSLVHKVYSKKLEYGRINLGDVRRNIENAYTIAKQVKYDGSELPAISEWFYDNRYLFIEQIKEIEMKNASYKIPHIKNGIFAHYPRSFALAAELAKHSSFYITINSIEDFLEAYQKEAELDSGELWILVDMLKIAILYAVAELAKRSVESIKMRAKAEKFYLQAESGLYSVDQIINENKNVLFNAQFIEYVMVLFRENPNAAEVIGKLNRRLSVRNLSADKLVKKAHAVQTINIMHISNAINSLRMLAKINFESIFENISAVHKHLCGDESYVMMDFESREYYRKKVSEIAAKTKVSEPAVSKAAIELSKKAGEHVGLYLAGYKAQELIKEFGKPAVKEKITTIIKRHMLLVYIGGAVISSIVSAALLCISLFFMYPVFYGIIGFVISLIPIYAVAEAINNRIFVLINKPGFIPKMALKEGITKECATIVAVTSLITNLEDGQELLEKMQVYYAANQQDNIYFTLLSDFKESSSEITSEETEIIEKIENEIENINKKYEKKLFFYAQRKRAYIPSEKKYSGKERKRGALLDFCRLLRGDGSAFIHVTKDIPQTVKYIITLDSDTELSRDAALKMVGAMEHPLNRPEISDTTNIVKSGYGVIQPRIGIDVVCAAKTRFSLVFSGKGGLDTYACASSDVYQDGFGTGIYTGKGIFEIDVYTKVLEAAFPDNTILSHDLLEGSYLRCALLSDVVLMDGCPAKYFSWAKRQHRWARGDWQLMPWLKSTVKTRDSKTRNPLPGLAKYQIIDNMRRSLVIPLSFIVILLSQTAFYRSAFFWFISGILPLFIDGLLDFGERIIRLIRNAGKGTTIKDAWYETKTLFEQSFYKFAFLPYETYITVDAIVRTIIRVVFTKKKLLEWETAAEGEKGTDENAADYWKKMRAAPILAVLLYIFSIVLTGTFSIIAFIVFSIWFFAPYIAYLISRPRKAKKHAPDSRQAEYLEDIALKTWRFFERFGADNEYCWMPDNYQQNPRKGIANRTSPTNIAFSLTSGIIAYYMGFMTLPDALARVEKCIIGIEKAPKWEGHLYNWYDIEGLRPLEPGYISSVDSGNLACYLIVSLEAINEMMATPIGAYLKRGIKAVYRESGKVYPYTIDRDADIYDAVFTVNTIDEDGRLSDYKKAFGAYFGKYAKWADMMEELVSEQAYLYTESKELLADKLRYISVTGYISDYNDILELLSKVFEQAISINDAKAIDWCKGMETMLGESYIAFLRLCVRSDKLKKRIISLYENMNFKVLYDEGKELFSIGYDMRQGRLSDTHYDLLASEARQTGFIAIAKGDVPGKHWFRLARPLTVAGDNRVLLSWGGTMFEYLMPLIIMKSYDNTLLAETYNAVVNMQSDYGELRRTPWGVSESGYYAFDPQMNYQYKAFGVPSLGMKSGLIKEMVVSPYSVFLALHVNARAAVHNLARLEKIGALGKYGFYEAVDYTQSRMQKGKKRRIIKSYMAHHQGMIFASILNCLHEEKLQQLFHSSMCVKATEMLLKEKVPPRNIVLSLNEKQPEKQEFAEEIHSVRTYKYFIQYPEAHFLSNGAYTVMLTQYGTGYSMYREKLINRWYSDFLKRAPGIHIYLKDNDTGAVWSAAYLPTCVRADNERAVFEQHKATFIREVGNIETKLDICVSPECDMEIRNIEINNKGTRPADLSVLCAYTPALCTEREFEAHPAFSELFIETEADIPGNTIYTRRRGRNLYNAMKVCTPGSVELLTDRAGIFGSRSVFGIPSCMCRSYNEKDVSRAMGIKSEVKIAGKTGLSLSFVVAAAETKQQLLHCLEGVTGEDDVKRVFHLAWTHAQVMMRYLNLKDNQADLFQRIASRTVISVPFEYPAGGSGGLGTLWKMGISGDLPIICVFAHDAEHLDMIKTVAKAQEFMSHKGVKADVVIIHDGGADYIDPLREKVKELEQAASGWPYNRIYALARIGLESGDISAIVNASCLVLDDLSPISEQLKVPLKVNAYEIFEQERRRDRPRLPRRLKAFDNGTGGFIGNGTEYCIDVSDGSSYIWSNILANRSFGSLITANGGGYTWVENARMKRLTPFRNDTMTDIAGEGVLIRNDRTGAVFSVMPDQYASGRYRITHGFGYTSSERFGSINTRATYFIDTELPVKINILEIENNTNKRDTFSVYYFAEQGIEGKCRRTNSEFKEDRLEAYSLFSNPGKHMFISISGRPLYFTASAFEFFGSPGNNITPEGVKIKQLSNTEGNTTVLALQTRISLVPGEKKSIFTMLGYGDEQKISEMTARIDKIETAEGRLSEAKKYWRNKTDRIKVTTSSKSFDTLINGWLMYQTYASRLFGRTGYYQSGGAYGFRDQLQDSLSLIYIDPLLTREIIVHFASRQFIEGDVLHWWHEPSQGVRTRISDDKLFLPYAACEYERITGDFTLFEETAPYLKGKAIPQGERDIYEEFITDDKSEDIFSHCIRAIDSALQFGEHGLPLMGTGDWNDGMDRIGEEGKGESVWLAFFLSEVLRLFSGVCRKKGEETIAQRYDEQRKMLRANIENSAWDGEWYMRAFFDDGTPVGSRESFECRIDLVSQAWAVLSGAAKAKKAFESAEAQLVMREEGVIRLLTPPFDKWEKDPGYIKEYLPGIRENGGQYSHAAVWFVIAAAKLMKKDTAFELFQMLNPINHTRTAADAVKYKGEPYVMAADVYYAEGQKGRAGWTWYTGTSGWMYQAAVIHLLGINIERNELRITPCLPDNFGHYSVEYRKDGALYIINVDLVPGYSGDADLCLDGKISGKRVKLDKTSGIHEISACWDT